MSTHPGTIYESVLPLSNSRLSNVGFQTSDPEPLALVLGSQFLIAPNSIGTQRKHIAFLNEPAMQKRLQLTDPIFKIYDILLQFQWCLSHVRNIVSMDCWTLQHPFDTDSKERKKRVK